MQHRETAEKATEALLNVAYQLCSLINMFEASEQEGKISKEEGETYRRAVMGSMDELLTSTLTPIVDIHPDLRPSGCCCCADPDAEAEAEAEAEEDNQS